MTDTQNPATPALSWAPEVRVAGENKWHRNQQRFATEEEAYDSATALSWRWTAVTHWRASPATEPVNYRRVNRRDEPI